MIGLSQDVDLSPLSRTELLQICFGVAQLQAHFSNQCSLLVESTIVIRRAGEEIRVDDYSRHAALLTQLLGGRLLTAARRDDGGLLLSFEGQTDLIVLNDSSQFESFQLRIAGRTFVA